MRGAMRDMRGRGRHPVIWIAAAAVVATVTETARSEHPRVINNDPVHPTAARAADLSPAMRRADDAKFQAIMRAKRTAAVVPWQRSLIATQEPQWTVFYCGPAAITASLRQVAYHHGRTWVLDQRQAARALGTTRDGTVWSDGTGSPVARVMNRHTPTGVHYVAHFVSAATPAEVDKLRRVVRFDIALDRHPIIGDAFEAPNSRYHLTGHPTNRIIFHWFNIRGYSEGGNRIHYQDSVAGASSVTWQASVPRYSSRSTVAMTSIVAGRGYVW